MRSSHPAVTPEESGGALLRRRRRNKALLLFPLLALSLLTLLLVTHSSGAAPPPDAKQPATATPAAKVDPIWEQARSEVRSGVLNTLVHDRAALSSGLSQYRILHGPRDRREIALTFDDGPHAVFTLKLLDILGRAHVKATFFLVGEMAEKRPDLVKAELAEGHCIGNHTYHHVSLTQLPVGTAAVELKACGNVLRDITGQSPRWFRPPGGDIDTDVYLAARALGYKTVLWNVFPGDSRSPGRLTIKSRVLDESGPGGIVLLHDGVQQTLDVLPEIIATLKTRGYRFVTLDEMLLPRTAASESAHR